MQKKKQRTLTLEQADNLAFSMFLVGMLFGVVIVYTAAYLKHLIV